MTDSDKPTEQLEAIVDTASFTPLKVGDVLESPEALSYAIEEELGDISFVEHRYVAKTVRDGANHRYLLLQRPGADAFDTVADCLDTIHQGQRVFLLPTIVDRFERDNAAFLVLERQAGVPLSELLLDLDEVRLTLIFEQIFLALSKLHRAGYILVNLRPEQVIIGEGDAVQVADFAALTRRGQAAPGWLGATPYLDAEALEDDAVDERVDILSAGSVFATAILKRYFGSHVELRAAVRAASLKRPVITQLLSGSVAIRDQRFLSVDEMRILLYQLKNEQARFPRPVAAMSSTVGISRHRYINEDSAGFQELGVQYQSRPQYVGFFCVADGMGGHELGERASQLAVLGSLQSFRQLTQEIPFERLVDGLPNFALTLGRAASEVVCSGAEQFPGGARMGTTFTGILVLNDEIGVVHVGDSRALLVRDKAMRPLTLDHSLVASLVRIGQMTEEEAATSDERNVLVRCIDARVAMDESGFDGLQALSLESGRLKMQSGDCAVILSDGVWGAVSDEAMLACVVDNQSPQDISDAIVRAAIRSGSDDNATALAICWS